MDFFRRDFLKLAGAGVAGATATTLQVGATSRVHPIGAREGASKLDGRGGTWDVKNFGARGDGTTIDTPAINRAIAAANAAGGGRVHFSAGTYVCYSIRMLSHVVLYLEAGATILAASTPIDGTTTGGYDAAESNAPWEDFQDFGHNHWHNSLIWGENLHDIGILGPGLIWGKGLSRGWSTEVPLAESPGVGNKAIALKNCHNVLLRDFAMLEGGHFAILTTGVDNLMIDNLKIDTNRDGMDIDCCRNVRITNCSVNSPWDDGICPKSSFALGYARATENMTISNCYVTATYKMGTLLDGTYQKFAVDDRAVPRIGRIKCGTESNGGFKNIAISNCIFEGCEGLALESEDGALAEDISVTNITMRDCVSSPLFLRLGSRMRGPQGVAVGQLRRILISNVVCSNSAARFGSILTGIPGHAIEDVKLSDIFIEHQGGGTQQQAAIQPRELKAHYPDPNMFGTMPAQGFFLRHMRNVELCHIEIASQQPDARPVFVLEDVDGASFFRVQRPRNAGGPMFVLKHVKEFSVAMSYGFGGRGVPDTRFEQTSASTL